MRFRSLLVLGVLAVGSPAGAQEERPYAIQPLAPPAWLGVHMDEGSDVGVRVESVVKGSPAEKAGIRAGDRIVSVESVTATKPEHVTRTVQKRKAGESISVVIERGGSSLTMPVLLASRPTDREIMRMNLVGNPAPLWTQTTALTGAPSQIDQLKGRVVVLDFWAGWCVPCRMIAPKLSALKDKYGAQGLTVVGLTMDQPEAAAVSAEKHQMKYGIVVDTKGSTSKTYGVSALPTLLVVDKKGVVRDLFVGFDSSTDAKLEAEIKQLLAEPANGPAAPVVAQPQPAPTPPPSPPPTSRPAIPIPSVARPPGR